MSTKKKTDSEYLLAYAPVRKPRKRKVKEIPTPEDAEANDLANAKAKQLEEMKGRILARRAARIIDQLHEIGLAGMKPGPLSTALGTLPPTPGYIKRSGVATYDPGEQAVVFTWSTGDTTPYNVT